MSGVDPLVARLRSAGCVFAEEEAALLRAAAPDGTVREDLVRRRLAGEPLEHVLGTVRLAGGDYRVGPGVFVPRQRSELLVDVARRRLAGRPPAARTVLVDLCCGSGAVGLALLATVEAAVELHLAERDAVALRYARRNAAAAPAPHRVRVHQGDLFAALPPGLRGSVDVLVAVPPYVPSGDVARMPPEARDHEPRPALDGGPDGLDVTGRIVAGAAEWLAPHGVAVLETAEPQLPALRRLVDAAGLALTVERRDEPEAVAAVLDR